MHERGIRIGLGEAVPVAKDIKVHFVLEQIDQRFLQRFKQLLYL